MTSRRMEIAAQKGKKKPGLNDLLEEVERLHQRHAELNARIEKLNAAEEIDRDEVFERVLSGYRNELQALAAELAKKKAILERDLAAHEQERKKLAHDIRKTEELLKEAKIRHIAGEYDDARYQEIQEKYSAQLSTMKKRAASLEAIAKRLKAFKTMDVAAPPREEAPPAPVEKRTKRGEKPRVVMEDDEFVLDDEDLPEPPPPADLPDVTPPEDALVEQSVRQVKPVTPPPESDDKLDLDDDFDLERDDGWDDFGNPLTDVQEEEEEALSAEAKEGGSPDAVPMLMVNKGPNFGSKFPLTTGRITVGRSISNDIQVPDSEVSRKHAEIYYENGKYILRDLDSSNGTFLNGKITKEAVLKHNDEISFGGTTFIVMFPK